MRDLARELGERSDDERARRSAFDSARADQAELQVRAAAVAALIVAMAGSHQLWWIDLATLAVEPWAGTGREDISDGPAFRTTLAQPMGLSLAGPRLYFADAGQHLEHRLFIDHAVPHCKSEHMRAHAIGVAGQHGLGRFDPRRSHGMLLRALPLH